LGGDLGGCPEGSPGGCTGGCPGGCPGRVDFKNPFKKNHALAQSLLSRVFSWDEVDVGFPTCSVMTVDRSRPLSVKRSGGGQGGRRNHHFREMRQPSAMSADDSGPVIGKRR
jgi:hypothetical protein